MRPLFCNSGCQTPTSKGSCLSSFGQIASSRRRNVHLMHDHRIAPPSGGVSRAGASTTGFTGPSWPTVYTFQAICQLGHSTPQRFTEAQVRAGVLPFVCGVCTSRWTSSRNEEAGMLHRIVLGELDSTD